MFQIKLFLELEYDSFLRNAHLGASAFLFPSETFSKKISSSVIFLLLNILPGHNISLQTTYAKQDWAIVKGHEGENSKCFFLDINLV